MCNHVQLCATSSNPKPVAIRRLCNCATCATVFCTLRAQDAYNFNALKCKTTYTLSYIACVKVVAHVAQLHIVAMTGFAVSAKLHIFAQVAHFKSLEHR